MWIKKNENIFELTYHPIFSLIVNASNSESHTLCERTMKFFFEIWALLFSVTWLHEKLRGFTVWKDEESGRLF